MSKITKELFETKVGREPSKKELDQCNCDIIGSPGHDFCGWCDEHDKPRSICKCVAGNVKYIHSPCCDAHWELAVYNGKLGLYCEKCSKSIGDRVKVELMNIHPKERDNNKDNTHE